MTIDHQAAIAAKQKQEYFLQLLRPVHDKLARFCYAMTANREEARDLTSETVLRAFEHMDALKNEGAFASYLFTIATRLHHRHYARRKRIEPYDETAAHAIEDTSTPADVSVDVQHLYHAMESLPEKQREAIVLFEISGLSLEEVREIQGGSLSGVKSRIVRARASLAKLLGVTDSMSSDRSSSNTPSATTPVRDNHMQALSNSIATKVNPSNGSASQSASKYKSVLAYPGEVK